MSNAAGRLVKIKNKIQALLSLEDHLWPSQEQFIAKQNTCLWSLRRKVI